MSHLFQAGSFALNSGQVSEYKIECDALTFEDWETLAQMIARYEPFGAVEGVPSGGLRLAAHLQPHADPESSVLLIVDDVLTTGGSMERHRAGREAVGVVVFARGQPPSWVRSLFRTDENFRPY